MSKAIHWAKISEQGRLFGLYATRYGYKIFGKKISTVIMHCVMLYYYIAAKNARAASKQYRQCVLNNGVKQKITGFKHFLAFGQMIIDKLAAWNDEIKLSQIIFPNKSLLIEQIQAGKGAVILTGHVGNIEVARSLSRLIPNAKINALVYDKHASKFNDTLAKINREFRQNMISLEKVDIALAIQLKEKVENGEMIVIAADRTSVKKPERRIPVQFLGEQAYLPEGAFILAGILKANTYFMACMKESNNRYTIKLESLSCEEWLDKKQRKNSLQAYAQQYANHLQIICKQYPLQWFNFFDFWHNNENNIYPTYSKMRDL